MTSHDKLEAAVAKLKKSCDRDAINAAMAAGFEQLLATNGLDVTNRAPGALYINAMKTGFYAGNPAGLDPQDREVAVLAILTVQGAQSNLALHVFIALASGIKASHVLDVILLAGMYSGANLLSQAMRVVTKTFAAIVKAADVGATGPTRVFELIAAEFPDPTFGPARDLLQSL